MGVESLLALIEEALSECKLQARATDCLDRRRGGVMSHVGSHLLADVADRATLTHELSTTVAPVRRPRARHDPGRVLVDLAVAVADGATRSCEIAVLTDQAAAFGKVASDSTCWRLLNQGPVRSSNKILLS